MEAIERVMLARSKLRPTGMDFIQNVLEGFIELHGDRLYGDDPAIAAGLARIREIPVTAIAQDKGHNTAERVRRNFGSPYPEGYRKALRQMKLAEKFHRPVICFVDTAGAGCAAGAEERGQARAIAENLIEMSALRVPIVCVLTGEGGSGGALALAVADEVWMLENSVYSVISPEGCASILWKDASKTRAAAQSLKLTAEDLYSLGIIERIIPEPKAAPGFRAVFSQLEAELYDTVKRLAALPVEELLQKRYKRFRGIGGAL